MGLFSKLFHGFYYIVDMETLKKYIQEEIDYNVKENFPDVANLNIFYEGIKHHLIIMNNGRSTDKPNLTINYDGMELATIEELYKYLNNIKGYFKIELIEHDYKMLNDFKKSHPELKIEDYE